ncbi:MAG: phosphotransferase enzyme family protein [Candidatus Saccharimonadales bacterium]|jgi:Ser/Thr protein kinase RdoA (MazF antagonist)
MEALVRRILAQYGFAYVELLPLGKGYRNYAFPARLPDGTTVNLMLYKREPGMEERIKRANMVADFAYASGLAARHTRDERIMRLMSSRGKSYAALYDYLPGNTIPWEAYTQKHIKQLGKTLSDLHSVLYNYGESDLPNVVVEYRDIVEQMRQYFAGSGVNGAMQSKLRLTFALDTFMTLDTLLAACEYLPNQQALHMDFVRSNILFIETADGPEISGILDFEKTAYGSPLFDIARTLAFLLVDCKYKEVSKVRKYFLYSGYKKRGTASFINVSVKLCGRSQNVLQTLVTLFLIYDFYKFLRHNPYEYLSQNEHFVRTRDMLLERKIIEST